MSTVVKCPRCGAATYRSRGGKDICTKCGHKLGLFGRLFSRWRAPSSREGPRCRSCGEFFPVGNVPTRVWTTVCPRCGDQAVRETRASDGAKAPDRTEKMAIYIFNSNKIDESVSGMYGAYAQCRFLEALHRVVQPFGGWKSLPGLVGCHGDLFDKDIFGKPTGTTVLVDWVKLKSTVSIRLAADFLDKLKVDPTKVGCIPYAIGVWPIRESIAVSTHNTLLSSDVIGYLGNLSLEPNPRLSFVDTRLSSMHEAGMSGSDAIFGAIASTLCLPVNMGIRTSGQCFGWLVSETEITKFGLSILDQTSKETQTTQKIGEARRALKNGDIKHAISLFEELAKLTSNGEERNKHLEAAENLRKLL